MKQVTIAIIMLILSITYAFANAYYGEESPDQAQVRQLDALAVRFKAETGFTGKITYDTNRMCFQSYEGKFTGINVTADSDTATFRSAFEQILDKVLPYTYATRNQLSRSRIIKDPGMIQAVYRQQVNGYRVEGLGRLTICYEAGRNNYTIGNATVELPQGSITPVITYAQAVKIYDEHVKEEAFWLNFRDKPFLGLCYSNIYNEWAGDKRSEYRLCWVGGFSRKIYIDALTGQVYKTVKNSREDYNVSVTADVMMSSDNTGSFVTTSVPLDNTWIQAVCDSSEFVWDYTDNLGHFYFQTNTVPDSLVSMLDSSSCIIIRNVANQSIKHNSLISNLPNLNFCYSNNQGNSIQGNPSNLYYHAVKFRDILRSLHSASYDSTYLEPVIIPGWTMPDTNGVYSNCTEYAAGRININGENGKYSSVLCHEMTHDFVYRSLYYSYFNNSMEDWDCMDEAFSSYFACMYRGNSIYRSQYYTKDLLDPSNTVAIVKNTVPEYANSPINENIYSSYHMRFPLASAWWSLRSNTLFPPDGLKNGIDSLLVNSLHLVKIGIPKNNTYRYKPRYFYNIMMSRVANDSTSWPLNDKQAAIDSAYAERGFYFTPQVVSADSLTQHEKNSFRKGESVYVKLSHCPQNTSLKVYIIGDREYTTDGMGIASLGTIFCEKDVRTTAIGDSGSWFGEIPNSNTLIGGDYDIVVDIGNNGIINFKYEEANVRDGFDGLTDIGFHVEGEAGTDELGPNEYLFDSEFVYNNIDLTATAGSETHGG